VLRFNTVDGEDYGRGRVEEFIGDLRSLDGLSQALVEGASVASKVIFLVSPSATTKPGTLAKAGNGAIIQGRPEDVGVVQVGKTADFSTAANLAASIEKRILEAFLVMNVRNAERVTAEEVRLTQLELEKSLGGLFSLLTIEFLVPYLNRTLLILQRSNQIPRLPKDVVRPKIVAGINSLGRGQDNEALTRFIATIAQTLGPEALLQYIDPSEAIKRLAAAQGIDVLNLVRTAEQLQQHKEERMQDMQNKSLLDQAGQLAGTPLMDPQKNPDLAEQASMLLGNLQPPPEE
jgi:ribosomal protein S15P/S13E